MHQHPDLLALLDAAVAEGEAALRREAAPAPGLVELLTDRFSASGFDRAAALEAVSRYREAATDRWAGFVSQDGGGFRITERDIDEDIGDLLSYQRGVFAERVDAERLIAAGHLSDAMIATVFDRTLALSDEDYDARLVAVGVKDLAAYALARPGLIERTVA